MQHVTVRAASAAVAFALGLAAVWLAGLTAPLEAALAEWLVPTSEVSVPAAPTVSREEDESREVYRAVLREMFGANDPNLLLVIRSDTGGVRSSFDTEVKTFDGASCETLADYNRKRNVEKRHTPVDGIAAAQVFLDLEQYEKFFADRYGNGWEDFNSSYPNSYGYTTLSAVGFNREGDEALLYVGRACGSLCGDGRLVLLRKKGPLGWEVEKQETVWVS